MDRMVFPKSAAVKHAVQPVQHEVGRNEEQYRLPPERKLRQRPMAIVVECDQFVDLVNVEEDRAPITSKPMRKMRANTGTKNQ